MAFKEVLRLTDVWVHYDGTPVLKSVDLSVRPGSFLGVIGPNGGGKTTLLRAILGLVKPSRGQVTVLGRQPVQARRFIGYVAQYNLFDRDFPISVEDVVLMGRYRRPGLFRAYSERDSRRADEALETVGMLTYRERQIGSLSGGEQQRVFIARALVTEPRILLLDEPTASIAPDMQTEFYELLEKLKQKMTIIMVSHDVTAVSIYVDDVACLNHQLFYHGSVEELSAEELTRTYQCPIQLIAHGTVPHRVLKEH